MKRTRLYLPWSLLAGLLAIAVAADGLKATALVLGKLKQKTTTEAPNVADSDGGDLDVDSEDNSTRSLLTGIPQQDYVHDPNLPRELNGYNLTAYPFFDRVPEEMAFKCDGLHDGFYASVAYQCQVYHHCLYGTRYDFLCANYTAFDQKTFICHFASEVDCVNSPKYFNRNEALYKATTTTSTTTTPRPTPPPTPQAPARRPQAAGGRRQRPYRRRRPVYDDYYSEDYDPEEYDTADYDPEYDDEVLPPSGKGSGRRTRKHPRRPTVADEPDRRPPPRAEDPEPPVGESPSSDLKPRPSSSVYDRPRVPPKVRRPVPLNERNKYDYGSSRSTLAPPASEPSEDTKPARGKPSRPAQTDDDDYLDDYDTPPARSRPSKNQQDYYPSAGGDIIRRPPMSGAGRPIRRRPTAGARRRPSGTVDTATPYRVEGEDDYEDELPRRPARPSGRKRQRQPAYQDDYQRPQGSRQDQGEYSTAQRSQQRGRYEEPVPAPRPSYISSASSARQGYRKRPVVDQEDEYSSSPRSQQGSSSPSAPAGYKRPSVSRKQVPSRYADEYDDEYYDDEEEVEEEPSYRRPGSTRQGSYKQEEDLSRPQSNKRPYTSSAPRVGSASSPRGSQRGDGQEERPVRTQQQSQGNSRPKTDVDAATPRSGYRPKVGGAVNPAEEEYEEDEEDILPRPAPGGYRKPLTSADDRTQTSGTYRRPSDEEQSKTTYRKPSTAGEENRPQNPGANRKPTDEENRPNGNFRKPFTSDDRQQSPGNYRKQAEESRSPNDEEEPEDEGPVRVPPSAYGNFRTKLTPSERDTASRAKYRPSGPDFDPPTSSTSRPKPETQSERNPPPPTASAKDVFLGGEPSGPGRTNFRTPSKVIIKPVTVKIPDNIPDRQNLADIPDEYDVTLNDALHPTLHPTRSIPSGFVLPQVPEDVQRPGQKNKGYQRGDTRYRDQDVPTAAPRVSAGYLEGSASQRYVTRTTFPVHAKEQDTSTDATLRNARRPVAAQYDEVPARYRQQDEGQYSFQPRPNWNPHPRVVRTYYTY